MRATWRRDVETYGTVAPSGNMIALGAVLGQQVTVLHETTTGLLWDFDAQLVALRGRPTGQQAHDVAHVDRGDGVMALQVYDVFMGKDGQLVLRGHLVGPVVEGGAR